MTLPLAWDLNWTIKYYLIFRWVLLLYKNMGTVISKTRMLHEYDIMIPIVIYISIFELLLFNSD